MPTHLYQALESLGIAGKRALGDASARLITDAQRAELRARLAHHRAHPEEPGMTLTQLKTKLISATR